MLARRFAMAAGGFVILAAIYFPVLLLVANEQGLFTGSLLLKTLLNRPALDFLIAPCVFLSTGLYPTTKQWIGACGFALAAGLAVHVGLRWMRKEQIDWRDVFYLLLIASGAMAAVLGSVLRIGYFELAGLPTNYHQFLAMRYAPAATALWLGAALYLLRRVTVPPIAPLAFAGYFLIFGAVYANRNVAANMKIGHEITVMARAGVYELGLLNWLYPHQGGSAEILGFLAKNYLGAASHPINLSAPIEEARIISKTPVHAMTERGEVYEGCRLVGIGKSGGDVILLSGEKIVGLGESRGTSWVGYSRTCDVTAWQ